MPLRAGRCSYLGAKRDMKRAGDLLAGIIEGLHLGEKLSGWKAVEAWGEIVGADVAGRTKAVRFEQGRLIVEVDSSARMAQLGFEKPALLEKLNARAGECVVRDLTFVMAGRSAKKERIN
jgi:predicted nucleic acid-binding Zn ribbon protein